MNMPKQETVYLKNFSISNTSVCVKNLNMRRTSIARKDNRSLNIHPCLTICQQARVAEHHKPL